MYRSTKLRSAYSTELKRYSPQKAQGTSQSPNIRLKKMSRSRAIFKQQEQKRYRILFQQIHGKQKALEAMQSMQKKQKNSLETKKKNVQFWATSNVVVFKKMQIKDRKQPYLRQISSYTQQLFQPQIMKKINDIPIFNIKIPERSLQGRLTASPTIRKRKIRNEIQNAKKQESNFDKSKKIDNQQQDSLFWGNNIKFTPTPWQSTKLHQQHDQLFQITEHY